MRVVMVDQKGPKVYGYFALATEIHDDSGAPHTLEHLIFMGSRSYKFKGILDKLATRAYSNTNAWTATDHTAYTLDTAGWEGFAQILPVYLEHVLLPTLTDEGCYTEVHHVDGTGRDAGVVYSEMQGTQNSQAELMDIRARRLLYPEDVGFHYETGGLMEQLRVLTADRIRDFHKTMYQPKNLCLVLIGEIDHSNLLQILDNFEDGILDEVPRLDEPFKRPWIDSGRTPALTKSVIDIVQFPEEDESMGEILIGFLGPDYNNDLLQAALGVFLIYICGSSVSLLENTIVEKEQLASAVYYSSDTRPDVTTWFSLTGVETKKLKAVERRFFEVLKDAAVKPLDMSYMQDCLHRVIRQFKFICESSGTFFGDIVIYDHLFGPRDGSQLVNAASLKEYKTLETWTEQDWREFFTKWFSDANHVSILGTPSKKLSQRLKDEEKARVKKQQEQLGEEGIKKLAEKLEAAKAFNDREIPAELLKKFKVPGTDSIHFFPTITARSGLARKMGELNNSIQHKIDEERTNFPVFIHFEHIPTNFVHLNLILCTHSIPVELRPLLTVYLLNFFDTPVQRDGRRVEFEEIVVQLEKDTVSYSIDAATSGIGNPELIRIQMQVEPPKYVTAIKWIRDLLFHSIFDETRLKATLAKIIADIPDEKRSGDAMAGSIVAMINFSRESSVRAQNTLVKALYLRRISKLVEESSHSIIANLETIRRILIEPSNFRVFVMANLETGALLTPVSSWTALTAHLDTSNLALAPLDSRSTSLSEAGKNPGKVACIVPISTIDSSYAYLTARGPDSFEHPQLPALAVAVAYLDAVEGPMWVAVRGTGLAYGTNFARDIDTGLLQFSIYRSPDAYNAFAASKKTVEDLATGKVDLDDLAMEGAVSTIVVAFANEQATMAAAAKVGFVNQVIKGIPKDWGTGFMRKVREVGKSEVKRVIEDMLLPVFSADSSTLVVTCANIMQETLVEGFAKAGFRPEVKSLSEFQDAYGLEGAEDLVDEDVDDEKSEDNDDADGEDDEGEE